MSKPGVVLPDTMAEVLYMDGDIPDEQCLEKKVYYKVISGRLKLLCPAYSFHVLLGLHASISTHICYETLDRITGDWVGIYSSNAQLIGTQCLLGP